MNPDAIAAAFATEGTPLIRTDFTDDDAWRAILAAVAKPVDLDNPDDPDPRGDGYAPWIVPVDDRSFDGATADQLGQAVAAADGASGYALLADSRAMTEVGTDHDLTLVYVDLSVSDPEDAELFDSFMGRAFRCAVGEIASIDANLSIANLDFSEFADSVGPDGVFRGFESEG